MIQLRAKIILCIMLLMMTACLGSNPEPMPDLGEEYQGLEFNKEILISVPRACNKFNVDNSLCLDVDNYGNNIWTFNIEEDIFIFQKDGNNWVRINDRAIHLGQIEVTLGAKGNFPLDQEIIGVMPDTKINEMTKIRIIFIFHQQRQSDADVKSGSFVDVIITPKNK